jgi:acyl-coenzyme A synthetase/AMP-(fatty) acid ligase
VPEAPDDAESPLRLAIGNEASEHDINAFARRFGCTVRDSYGSTEGVIIIRRDASMPAGALGFGEHVWVTPFWEDDVGALLGDVRAERLLLGSDWPHAEGTATPADFVSGSLADLPEGTVRRVARDNALDLLGLQVT